LYKENDESHIKLIDFGLAKKISGDELMTTPNGTPYYIAPEVLKGSYTT
jgi:calcium-dependent protein kinase